MDIERYADIIAHITHFGGDRADEVRSRLGVRAGAWEKADARWLDALSRDTRTEDKVVARAFGRRFVETSETLARDQPEIEGIKPLDPPEMSPAPAFAPVDETAFGVIMPGATLPFGDEPSPLFLSDEAEEDDAAADDIGKTAFVSIVNIDETALPFGAPGSSELDEQLASRLSMEQYASLSAELRHRPADRRVILTRYGVRDVFDELERIWEARFERSPEERRRFEQLVTQYRAWLERGR